MCSALLRSVCLSTHKPFLWCSDFFTVQHAHPYMTTGKTIALTRQTLVGKVKVKLFSRVRLFATPWTVALQAPPSMGFSRQEYWSVLPFPSPGDSSPRYQTQVSRNPGRCFNL